MRLSRVGASEPIAASGAAGHFTLGPSFGFVSRNRLPSVGSYPTSRRLYMKYP